jgi:hypothetical protein
MPAPPPSPRLLNGGIVQVDLEKGTPIRVIALQYNPHSVSRSLQAQWYEPQQGADRSERLRIKGPPVETIKLEAEIDATDHLEHPDQNQTTAEFGIQPQIAALETLIYPDSARLESNNRFAAAGTLEIVPMEAPLTLFVWSRQRVVPVRVTEFSIVEEFFDTQLNPIQAKVSLGFRVLTVDDLGFSHLGGRYYLHYHKRKEELRDLATKSGLTALGLERLPL